MKKLAKAGIGTLGDVWCWQENRWLTATDIEKLTGHARAGGDLLVQAVNEGLKMPMRQAMGRASQVTQGQWYSDTVTNHPLAWSNSPTGGLTGNLEHDGRCLYVQEVKGAEVMVRVYRTQDQSGTLLLQGTEAHIHMQDLVSVTVLWQIHKSRWATGPE